MNRYLKLVNFELNRFIRIYIVLAAITIISQIVGVMVTSNGYLDLANVVINKDHVSKETFIDEYGYMSFANITDTLWFLGPIALSIAALIFYSFFIWYRDWFGKNTFIYRLLMLPTTRINVYLAKATALFLMVLGLISLQLILLPIESKILQFMVSVDFRTDMSINEIITSFHYLTVLYPRTFIGFILSYGTGFMAVFVLFTVILFERSYRLKGILFGAIYGVLAIVVFFLLDIVEMILGKQYLYPSELLTIRIVLGLIVTALSIWVSYYLLRKKIRV